MNRCVVAAICGVVVLVGALSTASAQEKVLGLDVDGALSLSNWRDNFNADDERADTIFDSGGMGLGLTGRFGYMASERLGGFVQFSFMSLGREPEVVGRIEQTPTQLMTLGLGTQLRTPSVADGLFLEGVVGGTYAEYAEVSGDVGVVSSGAESRVGLNLQAAAGYAWETFRAGLRIQRFQSLPQSGHVLGVFFGFGLPQG